MNKHGKKEKVYKKSIIKVFIINILCSLRYIIHTKKFSIVLLNREITAKYITLLLVNITHLVTNSFQVLFRYVMRDI